LQAGGHRFDPGTLHRRSAPETLIDTTGSG
jgi:hypothetical protein